MARIRIQLEHDDGTAFLSSFEEVFELSGSCNNLSEIELAVEEFKQAALPKIEQQLLYQAQNRQVDAFKKRQMAEER